jgi:IstB-like ATP binding protein
VFGSERLTGALLDRLTHHVHVLEMNGDSYRLNQSKRRSRRKPVLEGILVGIIDASLLRKAMRSCSGVDSWRASIRLWQSQPVASET